MSRLPSWLVAAPLSESAIERLRAADVQPDRRTVADRLPSARQYGSSAVPSTPPLPGQP
ncbi:Transcriptional regulator, MocR family [Micromonospora lupini str. Lupac 08]|uniref:Transcriptional regulator, MocR family n=1 Tax=Micromonospora lupini str. Lupac 08 TaxID=1150864 RepID=I0KZ60_9ACTN|nr:Transcriptional regulator, MocR family [Micromonospora lupini str. Lupac 08]